MADVWNTLIGKVFEFKVHNEYRFEKGFAVRLEPEERSIRTGFVKKFSDGYTEITGTANPCNIRAVGEGYLIPFLWGEIDTTTIRIVPLFEAIIWRLKYK